MGLEERQLRSRDPPWVSWAIYFDTMLIATPDERDFIIRW